MIEKDIAVRQKLFNTLMRFELAPRSFAYILNDYMSDSLRYIMNQPLMDINKGSVLLTMSKVIADVNEWEQEDG